MSLLPARAPENFLFDTPEAALKTVTRLAAQGPSLRVFDALEASVMLFRHLALPLLTLAYDLFHMQADRSRYALYQARAFDFPVKPGDKVLDLGSGHMPFPLATHLADISLVDHAIGRAGVPFKHVEGKPCFECSAENTPFGEKEFDFVYCSHVLEHSANPEKACKELMRIAKRGYIETPTRGKDIFLASASVSNHRNYVELCNDVLTFRKYQPWEIEGLGCNILQEMCSAPQNDREKAFSALIYLRPRVINTMLLWEDDFKFSVV